MKRTGYDGTGVTMKDIVRATIDEFGGASGANGVSDEDINAFLAKLGVTDKITEIAIMAIEAVMVEFVAEVKCYLLARQTVGETYKGGGK